MVKRVGVVLVVVALLLTGCARGEKRAAGTEFFEDVGKTLAELKSEYPEGEVIVRLDGAPDSAAVCFGEAGAEYACCFLKTQSGDFERALSEYEDRLKCSCTVRKQATENKR